MALKRITVTPSDRQIITNVMNRNKEVDRETARRIREIAIRLETKKTAKMIERINNAMKELMRPAMSWGDLADISAFVAELNEELGEGAIPFELKGYEKKLLGPKSYTIDEAYLRWLDEAFGNVNWNVVKVVNQQSGSTNDVEIGVGVDQAIAIAEAADAIDLALKSEPVKSE